MPHLIYSKFCRFVSTTMNGLRATLMLKEQRHEMASSNRFSADDAFLCACAWNGIAVIIALALNENTFN